MATNPFENYQVSPTDRSTLSWRDKLRELATLKYGTTGKNVAEGLLGESEEEKYMNYLEAIEAGLLPAPKNFPDRRPVSDMFGGEGISDFGLLDASLMGLSGMAIPKVSSTAAAVESSVLGADALGEYKKGNTATAAIMGTLAGAPALLRYANPVKNTSSKEVADEVQPDLTRRKVFQGLGIGALAAPLVDPVMVVGKGLLKATPLQAAAKLTPSIPALSNSPLVDINSKLINLTRRRLQKELGEPYVPADVDYPISNMMYTLNETKNLNELSYKELKDIFLKEADVEASGYAESGKRIQKKMYNLFSSDEYMRAVLEAYENAKSVYKNDPTVKKLSNQATKAESEVMKLPGGFSNPNAYKTPAYARMMDAQYELENYINSKY